MTVHLGQDVVGGAVDDAGHPQHGVTGQRLGQRADHRDGAGDGRLEVEVDVGAFGGLGQLAGGCGQQRLVGRHHRLAVLEGGQDRLAGRLDRAHHLDDDVDVVARHQLVDVVGEQVDRHAAVGGDAAHPDAAQLQRRADASGQVGGAVLDDADNLAADIAQPQYRYADWLFVTCSLVTSLPDSTDRRRSPGAGSGGRCPSRTATTAGRPIRLYRLDIE